VAETVIWLRFVRKIRVRSHPTSADAKQLGAYSRALIHVVGRSQLRADQR